MNYTDPSRLLTINTIFELYGIWIFMGFLQTTITTTEIILSSCTFADCSLLKELYSIFCKTCSSTVVLTGKRI